MWWTSRPHNLVLILPKIAHQTKVGDCTVQSDQLFLRAASLDQEGRRAFKATSGQSRAEVKRVGCQTHE